jgi:hypothetical protein
MIRDAATAAELLSPSPGHTSFGLVVWLLVIAGLIGFLVSLFRR